MKNIVNKNAYYIATDDTIKIILSVKNTNIWNRASLWNSAECTASFPEEHIIPKLEGTPLKKVVKYNFVQSPLYEIILINHM